jgi:hypothetical protein
MELQCMMWEMLKRDTERGDGMGGVRMRSTGRSSSCSPKCIQQVLPVAPRDLTDRKVFRVLGRLARATAPRGGLQAR